MQPDTLYAKSGDVHIAYQVFGEGPLNVVFAPPGFTNVEPLARSRCRCSPSAPASMSTATVSNSA